MSFANDSRFRIIVEKLFNPVCILKGEQMILDTANQVLLDFWMVGQEAFGRPFLDILPEMGKFMDAFLDVYRNDRSIQLDEVSALYKRKSGIEELRYYNVLIEPFREPEESNISGVFVMANDITELVKARKKAEESESRLRILISSAPIAISTFIGEQLVVQMPNEAFIKVVGRGSAIEGRPFGDVLPELIGDGRPFREILNRVYATGVPFHVDEAPVEMPYEGGTEIHYFNITFSPLQDSAGEIYGILDISVDVTDMVKARTGLEHLQSVLEEQVQNRTEELASTLEELQSSNEELVSLNERLSRSNEELAQYAYVASHDLQEPLRKIHLYSDVLQYEETLSPKSRAALDKITAASSRMRLLISDLLDFSRLLQTDSPWGDVDLNAVVADVLTDFELVIKEKNAEVLVGPLPVIEAVRLQMNQLFYNLISNSLKFTSPGVSPVISISCSELPLSAAETYVKPVQPGVKYYEIKVSDNGIGFEQQFANRIFEVFKRLVGQQVYPGSGIGLALCKRIVVNHLGDIHVSSEPDAGATFNVILPDRQV